jgi:hypothetical protein
VAKDAYYFPHDSNARNDPKICHMRSVYGSQGYGWYWILIEMLRDEEAYKMQLKNGINAFAMQAQCDYNAAHEFVYACIKEYDLLKSDEVSFWSESLIRRMFVKDEKSEKARAAALLRWGKDDANAMRTQCERNASKEEENRKEKSKKEEKKICKSFSPDKIKHSELVYMKLGEYEKLAEKYASYGSEFADKCIEKLDAYKGQNEKNRNAYSDDYRAILSWVADEIIKKNQIQQTKTGQAKKSNIEQARETAEYFRGLEAGGNENITNI